MQNKQIIKNWQKFLVVFNNKIYTNTSIYFKMLLSHEWILKF